MKIGIGIKPTNYVTWANGQGDIVAQLKAAGVKLYKETGSAPQLFVVILPEGGNDIYTAVKQYVCYAAYGH